MLEVLKVEKVLVQLGHQTVKQIMFLEVVLLSEKEFVINAWLHEIQNQKNVFQPYYIINFH